MAAGSKRRRDQPTAASGRGDGARTIWTITGLLALAGVAAAGLIALAAARPDPETEAQKQAERNLPQIVLPMPAFTDPAPRGNPIQASREEPLARDTLATVREAANQPPATPPPPPPPTAPDAAVTMTPAPAPGLTQESTQGPLPVRGSDGEAPWQVYARPFDRSDARPRVGLVIGGLGFSETATKAAIDLPGAVTLAFSPYAPELGRWIGLARQAGHEVMIELPMEPDGYPRNDAGPAALLTTLEPARNRERLQWTLSRVTGYVGVKPLMGDRFMRSPQHLRPVLDELQERGVMMVVQEESDTDVGAALAREIGVPRATARLTVDAVATPQAIDQRLNALESLARREGKALAVADAWPVTLERVANWIRTIESRGVAFAPATALAEAPGLAPDGGAAPPAVSGPASTPATPTPASSAPATSAPAGSAPAADAHAPGGAAHGSGH
ncbi:divergent polysaccharide deacetylase family protein [Tistrella mobilis]